MEWKKFFLAKGHLFLEITMHLAKRECKIFSEGKGIQRRGGVKLSPSPSVVRLTGKSGAGILYGVQKGSNVSKKKKPGLEK